MNLQTNRGFFHSLKRGGAIISIVVAVVGILTGGIGLLILDAVTCDFNVIFGCGGGGGGGGSAKVNDPCSSGPNACGQTNTGFIVDSGGGHGSCNATPPSNASCPAPIIAANGFTASPTTIGLNDTTTLTWSSSNTTSCSIAGDNGFTSTGSSSGSVVTTPLAETTVFTLTCEDGDGGPVTSRSVKVIIDPHFIEI